MLQKHTLWFLSRTNSNGAVSLYERLEALPQVMEDIDNNYSDHDFEGSDCVDDGQLVFDKIK